MFVLLSFLYIYHWYMLSSKTISFFSFFLLGKSHYYYFFLVFFLPLLYVIPQIYPKFVKHTQIKEYSFELLLFYFIDKWLAHYIRTSELDYVLCFEWNEQNKQNVDPFKPGINRLFQWVIILGLEELRSIPRKRVKLIVQKIALSTF